MPGRKIVGLALAFGGLALIFSDKLSLPGPDALLGDLLSLGAGGLAWAATMIVIKGTRLVRIPCRETAALPACRRGRDLGIGSAARRTADP